MKPSSETEWLLRTTFTPLKYPAAVKPLHRLERRAAAPVDLEQPQQRIGEGRVADADAELGDDEPGDVAERRAGGHTPGRLDAVGQREHTSDLLHPGRQRVERNVHSTEEQEHEDHQVREE